MNRRSPIEKRPAHRAPLRIALIYLVVGGLWILLSDRAAYVVASDPETLTRWSTYKGWFYVLTTAVLLYGLIRRSVLELRRQDEREQSIRTEAEEGKRLFYKGTIAAVTDGKLNLVDHEEIEELFAREAKRVELSSRPGFTELRNSVADIALRNGMSEERTYSFVTAVGEAAANAIKHADGGIARIAASETSVQVCIQDNGPGMDTLSLPKATLMSRFSTKPSMGLGYSLILASVDSIYLATGHKGTYVVLEKFLREPQLEIAIDTLPDTW